ncbi:MAG: dihydrofolate reductase family protein, partial [Planctomycetota bacterium]
MLLALTLSLPLAGPLPTQEADDRPHVVFLTGDEEYRSEESMPMLAALLEEHYGCRTTVLYALDEQGYIAPNHLTNIAGLEALEDADLMVMFTRFRALPDDQLQHILDYAASGRPMVGFRTAQIDDPELTVRHVEGKQPVRIVIDPLGEIDDDSNLVRTA